MPSSCSAKSCLAAFISQVTCLTSAWLDWSALLVISSRFAQRKAWISTDGTLADDRMPPGRAQCRPCGRCGPGGLRLLSLAALCRKLVPQARHATLQGGRRLDLRALGADAFPRQTRTAQLLDTTTHRHPNAVSISFLAKSCVRARPSLCAPWPSQDEGPKTRLASSAVSSMHQARLKPRPIHTLTAAPSSCSTLCSFLLR